MKPATALTLQAIGSVMAMAALTYFGVWAFMNTGPELSTGCSRYAHRPSGEVMWLTKRLVGQGPLVKNGKTALGPDGEMHDVYEASDLPVDFPVQTCAECGALYVSQGDPLHDNLEAGE